MKKIFPLVQRINGELKRYCENFKEDKDAPMGKGDIDTCKKIYHSFYENFDSPTFGLHITPLTKKEHYIRYMSDSIHLLSGVEGSLFQDWYVMSVHRIAKKFNIKSIDYGGKVNSDYLLILAIDLWQLHNLIYSLESPINITLASISFEFAYPYLSQELTEDMKQISLIRDFLEKEVDHLTDFIDHFMKSLDPLSDMIKLCKNASTYVQIQANCDNSNPNLKTITKKVVLATIYKLAYQKRYLLSSGELNKTKFLLDTPDSEFTSDEFFLTFHRKNRKKIAEILDMQNSDFLNNVSKFFVAIWKLHRMSLSMNTYVGLESTNIGSPLGYIDPSVFAKKTSEDRKYFSGDFSYPQMMRHLPKLTLSDIKFKPEHVNDFFSNHTLTKKNEASMNSLREKYNLIKYLAAGANAQVYLVEDNTTKLLYVAKIFNKLNADTIEFEREITEGVSHVTKIDYLPKEVGEFFMIKPFIQGDTLRTWIWSGRLFLDDDEAKKARNQLVSLISHLIQEKSQFFDIHPDNLIFNGNFWVVIDGGTKIIVEEKKSIKQIFQFYERVYLTTTYLSGEEQYAYWGSWNPLYWEKSHPEHRKQLGELLYEMYEILTEEFDYYL